LANSVLFHSLRLLAGKNPKVDFPPGKGDCPCVNVHEMVVEMKLLERRLMLYEEKYGVLSEDFYAALMSGKLARYDAFDETRADFSRWKGIYETWRRRKAAYDQQVKTQGFEETLRFQPAY
jgi:hypothetical protein